MPETRITITECCGCGATHEHRESSSGDPRAVPIPKPVMISGPRVPSLRGSRPKGWVCLFEAEFGGDLEFLCPDCVGHLPLKAREAVKRMLEASEATLRDYGLLA